jgi:hypothetical protein
MHSCDVSVCHSNALGDFQSAFQSAFPVAPECISECILFVCADEVRTSPNTEYSVGWRKQEMHSDFPNPIALMNPLLGIGKGKGMGHLVGSLKKCEPPRCLVNPLRGSTNDILNSGTDRNGRTFKHHP